MYMTLSETSCTIRLTLTIIIPRESLAELRRRSGMSMIKHSRVKEDYVFLIKLTVKPVMRITERLQICVGANNGKIY